MFTAALFGENAGHLVHSVFIEFLCHGFYCMLKTKLVSSENNIKDTI